MGKELEQTGFQFEGQGDNKLRKKKRVGEKIEDI